MATTPIPQYVFGAGQLWAVPSGGGTPIKFGSVQGVKIDISFAQKVVYGRSLWPLGVYRGQAKLTGHVDFAAVNGAIFRDLFFGSTSAAGVPRFVTKELQTITANQVTVAHNSTFFQDLGVVRADNGNYFEKVAVGLDAPRGQQYTCNESTGVYSFDLDPDCHCIGNDVLVSYAYIDAANGVNVAIPNPQSGPGPSFMMTLSETFDGRTLTLVLNSCASSKLSMRASQEDFTIPGLDFTFCADANGSVGSMSVEAESQCEYHETFLHGLQNYLLVIGAPSAKAKLFSIIPTIYGNSLQVLADPSVVVPTKIRKYIGAQTMNILKVRFQVTSFGSDDAAELDFGTGVSQETVALLLRREATFDAGRRAFFVINNQFYALNDASVDLNQWYDLKIALTNTFNTSSSVLSYTANGAVVKTVILGAGGTLAPPVVSTISFNMDTGVSGSTTVFDEIEVC